MEGPHDDEVAVTVADAVREPNLAALELPLAVKPTKKGVDGALALIGGIEELSKVTADEVRGHAPNGVGFLSAGLPGRGVGGVVLGAARWFVVLGLRVSLFMKMISGQDCHCQHLCCAHLLMRKEDQASRA